MFASHKKIEEGLISIVINEKQSSPHLHIFLTIES